MRKNLLMMILCLLMFPAITCQAAPEYFYRPVTDLDPIIGTWYDSKGNVALTISSDYSINSCKVLEVWRERYTPKTIFCKISERSGIRTIRIEHDARNYNAPNFTGKFSRSNDYHELIIIDEVMSLRRTKEPRYFESVGGIYLGMSKDDVVKLYGQPSKIEVPGSITTSYWRYGDEFSLTFSGDVVTNIAFKKNGNRKFDWSGLSANNSFDEYMTKYNGIKSKSPGYLIIGNGEMISIIDTFGTAALYHYTGEV